MSQKRKRMSYEVGFKLRVVKFAEERNNCAAMREFGIGESKIRAWRKQKESLEKMPKTKRSRRGDVASFPELEHDLNEWVVMQRQEGYIVTRNAIRFRALQLKKLQFKGTPGIDTFLASSGWCNRFMEQYGLTLRQRTKISQKLPKQLEEKVDSFHKFVITMRKRHGYELSQIGNMDETPMYFDMPGNRTVNAVGDKSVLVKTTGNEKTHFTAVLACMANGTKLKPTIIFKRKSIPKNVKFPLGIIVHAHPKCWMDEGDKLWLQTVWNGRAGALIQKKSLLVWDMFRAHLSDSCKKTAREMKTDLAVIPGGLTSVLQPLDVCINKPFKDRLRAKWTDWMSSGAPTLTKYGNFQKPDIARITTWVKEAWESIPSDIVKNSFLKCGISNALDGTEDDAIYESGNEEQEDVDDDDDDDGYTGDDLATDEFLAEMFGESDDEEFN